MIEKVVLDYLTQTLVIGSTSIPCFMEVPADEPQTPFVVVEKVGSSRVNGINSASFAIQSYAPSLYEAAVLNDLAKEAMFNIVALDDIARVSLDSDYPFSNTATKSRRYQAIFDLTHY